MAVQRRLRKEATQPTAAAVEERFGGLVLAADTLGEIVLMIVIAAGGYFYWLHKARLFDIE
jgi:hypothetical protein